MKILFATDLHLRIAPPASRKDENYMETLLNKVNVLIEKLNSDYDALILGGDLFDRPDSSFFLVGELMKTLYKAKKPIYTIVGQHDIYGYQKDSIAYSPLAILFSFNLLNHLSELSLENVYIKGINVYDELNLRIPQEKKKKMNICIAHKLISEETFPGVINIKDIDNENDFDLLINGDMHKPHDIKTKKCRYIDPGSIARNSITDKERTPTALSIDTDTLTIDYVIIPARTDVFIESADNINNDISSFINSYAKETLSIKTEPYKIKNMLEKFLRENDIEHEVQKLILDNINNIQI